MSEKDGDLSKILIDHICIGIFLIGLGILFLFRFHWPWILVLVGLLLICEGLVKYYLRKRHEKERKTD